MRIVIEKGYDSKIMMAILSNFIFKHAEEYPILKENMIVDITLKNKINQIDPDNEREFYLGENELRNYKAEREEYYDYRLNEEWEDFIFDSSLSIMKEIQKDKNYILTATEKGRKPENIEKRKLLLAKNERRLAEEQNRMKKLHPFIELYEKKQVKFQYEVDEWGDSFKAVIFDIDGENYTFEYSFEIYGTGNILDKTGRIFL